MLHLVIQTLHTSCYFTFSYSKRKHLTPHWLLTGPQISGAQYCCSTHFRFPSFTDAQPSSVSVALQMLNPLPFPQLYRCSTHFRFPNFTDAQPTSVSLALQMLNPLPFPQLSCYSSYSFPLPGNVTQLYPSLAPQLSTFSFSQLNISSVFCT